MITGIDHVVVLVANLDEAMAAWRARGFAVERGGEHPGWGTENALIPLRDGTYLELLAVQDPALAARHRLWRAPDGGMRAPGEYGGFALASDELAADVAAMRARSLAIGDVLDGGRRRPDGQEVRWRLAFAEAPELPFLIQDVTPRTLRIAPPAQGAGTDLATAAVEVAAADLERAAAAYERLLGASPAPGSAPVFTVGAAQVTLVRGPRPGVTAVTLVGGSGRRFTYR